MEEMARLMNVYEAPHDEVPNLPNVFEILDCDATNTPWPQLPMFHDEKSPEPELAESHVES